MSQKITVIHHSADFDGLFCREIARKFLPPETEFIGWDFKDPQLEFPKEGTVYVLDLSPDCFWESPLRPEFVERLIWIDHHKTAIEKFDSRISGYRIDGVAACRLAWQWFNRAENPAVEVQLVGMPVKESYIDRKLSEPYAVQLAGEYDIWDKRNPDAEVFQFGLRSRELLAHDWNQLLDNTVAHTLEGTGMEQTNSALMTSVLLSAGHMLQRYQQSSDKGMMHRSFLVEFEGLKFLALTTARCNSLTFASKDVPETGHDALMGFYWNGEKWTVSMYHARHRMDLDLSAIAVKYGGGGHRGACGFSAAELPFVEKDAKEVHMMQLAGISTASIQNTETTVKDRIDRSSPYWSTAYADTCVAVDREMSQRRRAEAAEQALADNGV